MTNRLFPEYHIHRQVTYYLMAIFIMAGVTVTHATTYYVSTTGSDDPGNNGTTWQTAWATLSYACDRVPAGSHTIQLGPGTFQETTNAYPENGITVIGNGRSGPDRTTIVAPDAWDYTGDGCSVNMNGYIIVIDGGSQIAISGIEFINDPGHRANGAIYINRSDHVEVHDVDILNFRYAGMYIYIANNIFVYNCYFQNSAYNGICDASELGNITLRYISDSEFHDNTFYTDGDYGYGYRGRSQTNVKIYNNIFNVMPIGPAFDIEIAHEHEYGVEIYNNDCHSPISIPRVVDQPTPGGQGYDYTIRIHDNISSSSYAVEGSRNHTEIDHNFFYGDGKGGRCYQDHGANSSGPIWIHHNIAENVDRGFIFATGNTDNVEIYHNTVYMNENYSNTFIEIYQGGGTENWRCGIISSLRRRQTRERFSIRMDTPYPTSSQHITCIRQSAACLPRIMSMIQN